jgi:parallel beta-helix repeat protein
VVQTGTIPDFENFFLPIIRIARRQLPVKPMKPMKLLFLVPFILFGVTVNATNYYISASGNDNNNGTSSSVPWQSINKLNSVSGSLKPGDNVFFNRGDVFYGSISVTSSGSSTSPITFGAYGTGSIPVVSGFTNVTAWTNLGSNIWESTSSVSTLSDLKMFVINGQSTAIGRYPNGDGSYPYLPNYFKYQTHTGTGTGATSITSSFLGATNWTGAEIVIRVNAWTLDRETITSQSGTTLNYNGQSSGVVDNWAFFIQNDIRTLDQQNEWYYNPSTKKIDVYSTSMPTSVQVSTIDTLFQLYSNVPTVASVNIDNINFQGANTNAIWISGNLTFSVTNCNISYSGFEGLVLYGGGILSGTISNNTFYGNGSSAIYSTGTVSHLNITNNNIATSEIVTVVEHNDYIGSAIQISAPKSLMQYNTIDSSGYAGIGFRGDSSQVRNNFVNHSAIFKQDDAGIYTGFANEHGKVIDGNIILNSLGTTRGMRSNDHFTFGIYSDDLGTDIKITNNTVANCRTGGIYLHNSNYLTIRNNTIYSCGSIDTEPAWANGGISMDANTSFANNVHNNTVTNNIVFATNQYQYAINYYAETGSNGEVGNFGTIDTNYYVKINSPSTATKMQQNGINGTMDLSQWQSQTGKDKNSKISPKTISVITDTRFEYNPAKQPKVIALDASYIDVKGNVYNGSITLAPYSSVVLIRNGNKVNSNPTAKAGKDTSITLPKDSIILIGSGSDSTGTIVSYKWLKISGPSSYVMANDTLATMALTNLVRGIYKFQLTVTDNNGASGMDTVTVTVNASPSVNAGQDQAITLPTSSVTLSGNATDSDGTVVGYLWTKISGPSGGIIVNPVSVATSVTGLAAGIYQFGLKVTDNNGATAADTLIVTVNPAPNEAPVANAGSSQSIILPLNSVMLSGSGADTDGTVVSYLWSKISGPSNYYITSATSAVSSITNLVAGIYQFELQVTDNGGAIGTSVIQITVNPAGNIPPIAKVGASQSLTLPTATTTLSGSGSDSDGVVVSYLWTKLSGPSGYNIVNSASPVTDVSGLTQGIYQFELQVTDNGGSTGNAIIQITVNAAANIPPSANAGTNQSISLPVNSVMLSGSGNDPDGTVVSYLWAKVSGPSNYSIADSTSPVTGMTGLIQGVYQFELLVTDNGGATGTSIVQVTVNASANIPPTANAGKDTSIELPANSVTLTGIGTDMDGIVVSYLWTKISGPSTFNIADSSKSATVANGLVQGTYLFGLKVTDDSGATAVDSVQVTVNPSLNLAPVAYAGADQTITLPVNTVTLSGSGTDSDGTIVSYLWKKISGPSSCIIADSAAAATTVISLVQGNYQFELRVTDNKGAATSDTMVVKVNLAGNISPTANAGLHQTITLPVNSISLSGSGTDSDGSVVAYLWTKISGPAGYSIANPTSAGTSVTGLVQGIYQFQLQVTDNAGAVGTSTIKITVNPAPNIPPVANAGPDQAITLPLNNVTLSGSGTDADGTVVSYLWTEISGPSKYIIVSANTVVTNVTGLIKGVYKFQLQVTDNKGASAPSIVKITVNNPPNQPPVANAGAYQAITLPTNSITLSGIGTDADGTVVGYQWIKISGPSNYNIAKSLSPATSVSELIAGVYQFQLKVIDNDGAIGTAISQVTVNAAPNVAPTANAGTDEAITLPTNNIVLSGSGTDTDGSVVGYLWTKISGPASYITANPASAGTSVTGLVQGTYQFQLQVTDNDGAIGTATIKVTVNPAPNIAPVANAGSDQAITLPLNTISLSGSGTDADGTVVSYLWTEISGPSSYTIVNPASASTSVSGLVKGIYQFQLTVADNKGAISTDVVQVNVNAAPNHPPVAKAGPNVTITLPVNSGTLSGSGSDPDGTVTNYSWTKISGPSKYSILNPTSSVTNITGLVQGVYQFELKVTDNDGATATGIVQVTVNAAPNQPPVANAGINQTITLPVNSVTLSGTGTDADGTVVSYTWSQVSGPSVFNIVKINSATTNVTGLISGLYQFELKVTDNSGARGRDTVQVTVNAAINIPPTANAGPDKTITLPVSTTSLSGSGSDADGTITSYTWIKIGGPSASNFVNANSPITDVWGLTQGIYLFELRVTDNDGAIGRDTVKITVTASNIPPVANAGPDQTISIPDNSVTLSGSGADSDGTITTYSWKQIAGPAVAMVVSSDRPNTVVDSLIGGNYEFELTVIDNNGAIGKDTVTISVAEPRLNLSPQSNDLKVYPNPVIATTTLEINRVQTNSNLGIVITDTRGQTIYKKESVSTQNHTFEKLDLSNLAKGIYFITTYFSNTQKQTVKILKL